MDKQSFLAALSNVNGDRLREVYSEAKALGLQKPITVYGHVSTIAERETFRFEQVSLSRKKR